MLGNPEQLLSAERHDPIEQEAGVGDHDLAMQTLGLPAIAEPVDESMPWSTCCPGGELGGPGGGELGGPATALGLAETN